MQLELGRGLTLLPVSRTAAALSSCPQCKFSPVPSYLPTEQLAPVQLALDKGLTSFQAAH